MSFDLSDPVVTASLISLGGIIVAATAGVVGAIAGARIAANAARDAAELAQAEAQADREEARRTDELRCGYDTLNWLHQS